MRPHSPTTTTRFALFHTSSIWSAACSAELHTHVPPHEEFVTGFSGFSQRVLRYPTYTAVRMHTTLASPRLLDPAPRTERPPSLPPPPPTPMQAPFVNPRLHLSVFPRSSTPIPTVLLLFLELQKSTTICRFIQSMLLLRPRHPLFAPDPVEVLRHLRLHHYHHYLHRPRCRCLQDRFPLLPPPSR